MTKLILASVCIFAGTFLIRFLVALSQGGADSSFRRPIDRPQPRTGAKY
jgi:hypothetical protein